MDLTTEQIIRYIEEDRPTRDFVWNDVLEDAVEQSPDGSRDAADAARFLEKLEPGRTWSAAEYHGLMTNHFTGRWKSAAHIGRIRAQEMLDDAREKHKGDDVQMDIVKRRFAERTASDEAAGKFVRALVGTYVFDCADKTVLTFDRIFGGILTPEDPS